MITHPVLHRLAGTGVKLGLERIQSFLTFLGEPHRSCPVVHIGGTNGKGSTCTFVASCLAAAGYRVGTTLSPHVEQLNERVRIDGLPISDPELVEAIEHVDRARWDWARSTGMEGEPLTYYEMMVSVAFWVFARQQVDVAVVEVGVGGRLDASNVVAPQVVAITSVAMDHMEMLGESLDEIATEKAGIMERGVPVVLGAMPAEARRVIERHAEHLGAPLWRPGRELTRELRRGRWGLSTPAGALRDLELGLEGEHQGANALTALGVLHQLRAQGFVLPDAAIRQGLESARLEGRLEQLAPGLVADGAHNPHAARALARWLQDRPRPRHRILLVGMATQRDPVAFVQPLLPLVDEVVATRCAHPKAWEPGDLATCLQDLDIELLADGGSIDEALTDVYVDAEETIVAGSLYLAGAARSLVAAGALRGLRPGSRIDEHA